MKNKKKQALIFLLLLCVCCCYSISSWAFQQEEETQATEQRTVVVNEAAREELHRYMGYEKLMPKYISLPYDISMQTNVQGTFLDIGYLLLLFLPILLLLRLKNSWLRLVLAAFLLLVYIISTVTGYSASKKLPVVSVTQTVTEELDTLTFSQAPLVYTKLQVVVLANHLYQPINTFFTAVSGEGDRFTYSLLVLLFLLGGFLINQQLQGSKEIKRIIVYLGYAYGFFWLILGAGIIWYGFLLIPLGLLLLGIGFLQPISSLAFTKPQSFSKRIVRKNGLSYAFLLLSTCWIILAFTARMANYAPLDGLNSKGAINRASLLYGLGKADEAKAMDLLYPNFNKVLAKVNADKEAQVYRIGTFFHYFIKDNNKRVLADNQLVTFSRLTEQFPDKAALTQAFKRSGYKYLLLDLNVASIDNTPDQSLTKKAAKFSQFLVGNPSMRFIATDRVMLDSNGQLSYTIFGKEMKHAGTFAAFEIL